MPRKRPKAKAKSNEGSVLNEPTVKLLHTLQGDAGWIGHIVWSPDGRILASPSEGGTIRFWNTDDGKLSRSFKAHSDSIWCVAFDPTGRLLASASSDKTVSIWDVDTTRLLNVLKGHRDWVMTAAFDPTGQFLATAGADATIMIWEATTGKMLRKLVGHKLRIFSLVFDPSGKMLASAGGDSTVKLWDPSNGQLLHNITAHNDEVNSVAFDTTGTRLLSGSGDRTIKLFDSATGRMLRTFESHTATVVSVANLNSPYLFASKGEDGDDTIRFWNVATGNCLGVIREASSGGLLPGLAFNPQGSLLASVASDPAAPPDQLDRLIHIWRLDLSSLLERKLELETTRYVNAKVVLVGDTGVGKSGLTLVLNGRPFEATDSTPGRRVWTFQSHQVKLNRQEKQTRETLLWDLAGQPGYRVIHQLHLNEVAVALVVFDARSETDPLAGVRHWERALRLAQQRQGASAVPLKKFLISARADRGTVSVSKERLESLITEFGFEGYFETSAKEGWKIKELNQAIKASINWADLPEVSSSVLFGEIKTFLLNIKKTGRLVARANQLYVDFVRANRNKLDEPDLRKEFDTCIGRLENRDLIRQLSFGGYILLQPELLDAYGSAMVNAAKKEPDGLGSIAEDVALNGQFYVPEEHKVKDRGQEQLLLHATVEELVRHDLALRESATDGRYLVFPSEFIRDYEAAPEPEGKAVAISFDGPVQSLYCTLAVRLGHSGLFTTGRTDMWRNAAVFTAKAGGKCGIYLHEFEEARGRLIIFYDQKDGILPSIETRFHFEEFVFTHTQRHALSGTVQLIRFFVCSNGHPVPDAYVRLLTEQNKKVFECPCGEKVPLAEPKERLHFESKVPAMDRSADRQREFEIFVESARGETITPGFTEWAGDDRVTLAIVFTDVVGSTALNEELKDAGMNELRRSHFEQSRSLIHKYKGREIKTIGDSFMAAFRSVGKGLDYAMALQANPGHAKVKLRAGVHIGPMTVEENDVFGGTVNFAARVVSAIKGPEIWLSDEAKSDLDGESAKQRTRLKWKRQDGVEMKGFNGTFTLWSLEQ